jgi:multiple sugar transport system substrate-binding protein
MTRTTRRTFVFTTSVAVGGALAGQRALASPFSTTQPRRYGFQDGGTLKIAINGAEVDENTKKLASEFESAHEGTKVEFIPLQGKDWNEYFSKLLTMVASGTVPDLTTVATEGTQLFAGQGLATPLDDYVKNDAANIQEYFTDVHPALVESMMYEGNLYQLPQDFNAANMYINTKTFSDHGIEYPAADWTKDQFYDIAKTITKEGGGPPFGYAWVNRLWGGWMPWIFVNGSNLLTEEKAPGGEWLWDTFYKDDPAAKERGGGFRWNAPQANSDANVEALEFMVQMAQEKITPSPEAGGGGLLQGLFTSGQVATTPAGGFWAGGLHNAGMKTDQFDVQLFPKWKSQRHQFGAAGLVMFEKSENKDLAWEYIKHHVSKPMMETFFQGNPTTPTRRSMMTAERYAETGPAHWQVFYDTLEKNPDTAPIPAPPSSNEMTAVFMKYTSLAMNFQQDPKTALDNMQKDLEGIVKPAG